jgi:hypothetical protein
MIQRPQASFREEFIPIPKDGWALARSHFCLCELRVIQGALSSKHIHSWCYGEDVIRPCQNSCWNLVPSVTVLRSDGNFQRWLEWVLTLTGLDQWPPDLPLGGTFSLLNFLVLPLLHMCLSSALVCSLSTLPLYPACPACPSSFLSDREQQKALTRSQVDTGSMLLEPPELWAKITIFFSWVIWPQVFCYGKRKWATMPGKGHIVKWDGSEVRAKGQGFMEPQTEFTNT